MGDYPPQTLHAWSDESVESARTILPLIFALSLPASVIDVGCSIGNWAAVCGELGVDDVMGVDGDYVDRSALRIPESRFVAHDLTQPLRLDRTFELAISLEVAEHLPEERADGFVADLCRLAPMVLFSAAIPYQGGLQHINEQWPAYWAQRFADHGHTPVDCVRDEVWDDPTVSDWYAQNTLLFVSDDVGTPAITRHYGYGRCAARVHPAVFIKYAGSRYQSLRRRVRGFRSRSSLSRSNGGTSGREWIRSRGFHQAPRTVSKVATS